MEGWSQSRESVPGSQSCFIRGENNIRKFVHSCLSMNESNIIHLDLVNFYVTTRENSTALSMLFHLGNNDGNSKAICTSPAIGKLLSWWSLSIPLTLANLSPGCLQEVDIMSSHSNICIVINQGCSFDGEMDRHLVLGTMATWPAWYTSSSHHLTWWCA